MVIYHQLSLFWCQLMLYWKWPQFWILNEDRATVSLKWTDFNKQFFSDQFQCINSNNQTLPLICIDKNLVCDGTEDCPNGLDEKQDCPEPDRDCGIGKYYCPSSKTCFIICDSNSAATCPEGNLLKGIDQRYFYKKICKYHCLLKVS